MNSKIDCEIFKWQKGTQQKQKWLLHELILLAKYYAEYKSNENGGEIKITFIFFIATN